MDEELYDLLKQKRKEEAIKYIEELATFFNAGWKSLITFI